MSDNNMDAVDGITRVGRVEGEVLVGKDADEAYLQELADLTDRKLHEHRLQYADGPLLEARQAVEELLIAMREDITREGLRDTPTRVARWYDEHFNRAEPVLTTFENEGTDEMVIQCGIPFYSLCEHHMVPFFGTAVVAYIPSRRIVGLSKLARLVQYHARGLQTQERITHNISEALEILEPHGIGVLLRARHLCMEMRGIKTIGAETVTSDLRGVLREEPSARAEFLTLARGR
jgi:GTP cyclohydrolase I